MTDENVEPGVDDADVPEAEGAGVAPDPEQEPTNNGNPYKKQPAVEPEGE
jgi:hypothetical protein